MQMQVGIGNVRRIFNGHIYIIHKDQFAQVEMSSEIKSLDSDMQMLVYENYNKFISATDTIRSMKCSVEEMDAKMLTLKNLIGRAFPLEYNPQILVAA